MQFDKFDKKVREAAEHHHPAYDERAWDKMEQLLNKHLPREEDNRRRFLFLLFLFLGLGSIGLLIAKPWKEKKQMPVTKQVSPVPPENDAPSTVETLQGEMNENKLTGKEKALTPDKIPTLKTDQPLLAAPGNQRAYNPVPGNNSKSNKTTSTSVTRPFNTKRKNILLPVKNDNDKRIVTGEDIKNKQVIVSTAAAVDPVQNAAPAIKELPQETLAVTNTVAKEQPMADDNSLSVNVTKENKPQVNDRKEKNKSKKNNSFLFTLSAGPDVSFVGNDQFGRMKLLAGAGIGYSINNRLIIRTGFYSGRKVYSASPEAYHPPPQFYTYYPYLEKISADCKVYEIPLTLSYNFSKSSTNSFMATAGLSSYVMRKETYDYTYKYNPSGPVYTRQLIIDNEYKHLFAVLTLSGGYQRNLGKQVSVLVEPYMKLPLSGAGYGKVKLNSAGVLLSVGVKPFAAKKKNQPLKQ